MSLHLGVVDDPQIIQGFSTEDDVCGCVVFDVVGGLQKIG